MDGGERAAVAGVEGLQEVGGLAAAPDQPDLQAGTEGSEENGGAAGDVRGRLMSAPRTQRSAKELFAWPTAGPSRCSGRRVAALATMYPLAGRTSAAGAVNPALQQIDFYIRSPDTNDANHPSREVFDHFFAMETTWR